MLARLALIAAAILLQPTGPAHAADLLREECANLSRLRTGEHQLPIRVGNLVLDAQVPKKREVRRKTLANGGTYVGMIPRNAGFWVRVAGGAFFQRGEIEYVSFEGDRPMLLELFARNGASLGSRDMAARPTQRVLVEGFDADRHLSRIWISRSDENLIGRICLRGIE